ncbi:hypothetical protein ACG94M_02870 [Acinetobacter guillouiae]|uniref:hypothetical protein n=1 Tax=Acinetobacter guillouiae TaxID=106649 RepID=UPI003AF72041
MHKFIMGIIMFLGANLATASETVFEINNKLSEININKKSIEYSQVFDELVGDLREHGISFSYDGTMVKNDYRGAYFLVKNVQVYIKKEIFEKYKKQAILLNQQTFFYDAIKRYEYRYIFSNSEYQWAKPKLKLKMEILDENNRVMASRDIKTQFKVDGTGVMFEAFFRHLLHYSKENKDFSDESIADKINIFRDYEIYMSLEEMQRIKTIKFRVEDN